MGKYHLHLPWDFRYLQENNFSFRIYRLFLLFVCFLQPADGQEHNCMLHTFRKHSDAVHSIGVHPDGNLLVTGSKDRSLILWDLTQRKELVTLEGNPGDIQAVAFSPDGKYVVGSARNLIRIWTITGEYINAMQGHATAVWSMDFNPEGTRLVTGSFDRNFRLWDFIQTTELHLFEGHQKSVLSVAFSPHGKYIASGSLDETILIWDAEEWRVIKRLSGHTGNIYSLDFSPDGTLLASASRDNTIRLWNIPEEKMVRSLEGHTQGVFSVCFSPDGYHLLSGSLDQTIKLWETVTGTCLFTFTGHTGGVSSVRITPDGKYFVSSSYDNTAILWELKPEIFVDFYFKEAIEKEMAENPLFAEKTKSESRTEYSERMAEAARVKEEMYRKYYRQYRSVLEEKKP